ncbi:MAG: hypothetical protein JWL88_730 [Parcubacteria group bacterium]|nr:hypothetical protein [Parcubacteria group bacterium]
MPEGSALPDTDPEAIPFFLPADKHDAGLRISKIARIGRRRPKIEARFDRKIAKAKARADELKREKDAALRALDADSGYPAHELMEYLKRCWDNLTRRGSTKQVSFWSGAVSFRNLPDRAVVNDAKAFMAEARRRGKASLLITRGADKPNLTALNRDLALAARFKTVTIERKSSVTIRPKLGWGVLKAILPRKMDDTMKIEELIGSEPLAWEIRQRGDDE